MASGANRHAPELDPVTLAVLDGRLQTIAAQMQATLIRTAYSANIKERADCSSGLLDLSGRIAAQATQIPLHLGSLLTLAKEVTDRFSLSSISDDDVFILNDPYSGGGTHLPDITVVAPIVPAAGLIGWSASIGHHSDIGGRVPGGQAGDSKSIYEEGLRLPPMKLADSSGVRRDVVELVLLNSRTPEDRRGDIHAQIAAIRVGQRGLSELCREYGPEMVSRGMSALMRYTERRFRSVVREVRNGSFYFEDTVDDTGVGDDTGRIACSLTVDDDQLKFDFTGTDPQFESSKNIGLNALLACVYAAAKSVLDPSLPPNSGYYNTISVIAPLGSFVNPRPPAAVGERAITTQILGDVLHRVLSMAVPERAMAACGPYHGLNLSGWDPRRARFFVTHESYAGGLGAIADRDGLDSVRAYSTGSSNLPVEALEHEFPMRIRRYELRRDSGGAGRYRGGLGIVRDIENLGEEVRLTLRSVRQRNPAWGVSGGESGAPGEFVLNPDTAGERRLPSTVTSFPLETGDTLRILTPGGGGFGDKIMRGREAVRGDIADGRVERSRS